MDTYHADQQLKKHQPLVFFRTLIVSARITHHASLHTHHHGLSMSLYQIRLNVRYTTGRSASLLLAPVVGVKAHMRHGPAGAARSDLLAEGGRSLGQPEASCGESSLRRAS